MKKFKSPLFIRICFLALICLLFSISGLQPIAAQDLIRINIFVGLGTGTNSDQIPRQRLLAKRWNDDHPDIMLDFDFGGDQVRSEALRTLIASGNPPDIIGPMSLGTVSNYQDSLLDLSSNIGRDKAELKLDQFDANVLGAVKTIDGRIFALPLGIYPSALYVNEDMFAQAGVPLPPTTWGAPYTDISGKQVPWDWETLAKVAQLLTLDNSGKHPGEAGFDPDNIVQYGFTNSWSTLRDFAAAWGSSDSGIAADGKAHFNQDAYVKAVTWLHNGIFKDHFIPTNKADSNSPLPSFPNQRAAMFYGHSWFMCCIKDLKSKWNVYAGPAVPGTNGQRITAPVHVDGLFSLAKDTKHLDIAWEVLKWLNSPENAEELCDIYGCMPTRNTQRGTWEKSTRKQFPGLNTVVFYAASLYADSPNSEGPMPNYDKAAGALSDFYNKLRDTPDFDVKGELAALDQQMQAIFDEHSG